MSWSISIPATPKADFDAAVDAAKAAGQDAAVPGLSQDVTAAKVVLKALAKQVKRAKVAASASGHCLEPGQDKAWHDGISVGVSGTD